MKLYVLMAQRKERYPGEYAPEALDVIDEWADDDNPDYMARKLEEAKESRVYENVVVVTLKVNGAQIMEMLRPTMPPLNAEIQ